MSLALIGLFSNEALPERPAQEQEDAEFAAMMGLLLSAPPLVQQTPIESVVTQSMDNEVRTSIVPGDSGDIALPAPSGEMRSLVQANEISDPRTSQPVTELPESNRATQAVDLAVDQSQSFLSRPLDKGAQDPFLPTAPVNSSIDVKRLDTTPNKTSLSGTEGSATISVDDVLTDGDVLPEALLENAQTVSTPEDSTPVPESEASSEREASSGAEPAEGDRFAEPRRSEVASEPEWQHSGSMPRLTESTARLQTEPTVSGVTGGPSTFHFAESITAEMQQPLSTQVSRAVLDFLERPVTQDADSLTLRLDPPELGEMVIEVSRTRDGLAIRVSAREAVTMEMLFSRGHEIESHLRARDVDLKSLEFLSSGSLGGQTSSEQHRGWTSAQRDSETSIRRSLRRSSASGAAEAQRESMGSESPHAFNFRA